MDKYTLDLAAQFKDANVLLNGFDSGWLKTDLGGEYANYEVKTVMPGALILTLLVDFAPSGILYQAQDYKLDKEGV